MKPSRLLAIIIFLSQLAVGNQVVANEPVALEMNQAASGNFYLHASLGSEISTEMLLDTGAGYVSLSETTFKKLKAQTTTRFSRYIYGAMANGNVEKVPLYFLDELAFAENCVLRDLEVAVMPGADRDILGLNALALMQPFTLTFTPARLSSKGCNS